jgi:uncharacterized membrane protein
VEDRRLHANVCSHKSTPCEFEGYAKGEPDFHQLGINLSVLRLGESMGMYRWEAGQEGRSVRTVSRYEWLLSLHIASGLAFFTAYTIVSAVLIAGQRTASAASVHALLRLARPADVLAWIGATGTLVFGVWLAVELDAYELSDGWVVGAFVLWLVAEEVIRREDLFFKSARRIARATHAGVRERTDDVPAVLRSRQTLAMHVVGSLALLGLLFLMIFKPGAG